MVIECSEIPPRILSAGELHHAGHEHQFEKKKLEEKNRRRRRRGLGFAGWPELPRREKNRQETGLEQQHVPLVTKKWIHKPITDCSKRKIRDDETNQQKRRCHPENQQYRQHYPGAAE